MPSRSRYDDANCIDAFLSNMRLLDEELAEDLTPTSSITDPTNNDPTITEANGDGGESLTCDLTVTEHEISGTNLVAPGNETTGEDAAPTGDFGISISSAASSPTNGTRAPPPTPENNSLPKSYVSHLPPIREDQPLTLEQGHAIQSNRLKNQLDLRSLRVAQQLSSIDEDESVGVPTRKAFTANLFDRGLADKDGSHRDLHASRHADKRAFKPVISRRENSSTVSVGLLAGGLTNNAATKDDLRPVRDGSTVGAGLIACGFVKNPAIKNDRQQALEKFRAQAEARIARMNSRRADHEAHALSNIVNDTRSVDVEAVLRPSSAAIKEDHPLPSAIHVIHDVSPNVVAPTQDAHEQHDKSVTKDETSEDDDSSIDIIVDAQQTPELFQVRKSTPIVMKPDLRESKSQKDVKENVTPHNHVVPLKNVVPILKEENREHAIYFPTWGAPLERDIPPARVRKVVISNLPPSTDFSLVQSLVHGGAIDEIIVSKASDTAVTAFVTFTDAESCDSYYNAYPNGLSFRKNGKNYVAYINKGDKVDVVSSALQSYLECGATRVVKVDGADEDWSMRALYKLAVGNATNRKVESIIDNCKKDSRSITFRFTKISEAVTFRGSLLRNPEWEGSRIEFAADPCQKATGPH